MLFDRCPFRFTVYLQIDVTSLCLRCLLLFDLYSDGPDKAEKLTADRGDHLTIVFAPVCQLQVARVQAVLCLPRDLFYLFAQSFLSLFERGASAWTMLIRPGGLNKHAAKMSVARLCYAPRCTRLPLEFSLGTVPL